MKRDIGYRKQTTNIDRQLFWVTILLTTIGLVFVADASAPAALASFGDKYYFVKQQVVWGGVGLVALVVVSHINFKFWKALALPLFGLALVVLIAVLIPGLGTKALGARRWLAIGPFSFQPAEFVKLALAAYLAKVAASSKPIMAYIVPLGLIVGLMMLQPDLGTTIILALIAVSQMFVSGVNLLGFAGLMLTGGAGGLALILTSSYRRDRLLTFLQQTTDPLGKGYHIRQILLALGAGGWFGVGFGQSRQKYLFLPESATDSILAVIAEEVGFVGTLFLVGVYVYFVYLGLRIAKNSTDTFAKIFATGLVAWIGGQALLNMFAMVALVPLTGIPLPLISYGGSSLTMVLMATGILLNISRYAKTTKS